MPPFASKLLSLDLNGFEIEYMQKSTAERFKEIIIKHGRGDKESS